MIDRARWLVVAIAMTSAGCYDWEGAVRRTAAFDHHCDPSHISILGDDHATDRSVQLYVCGEERSYRDVPFHNQHHWVDYTTDLVSTQASTTAAPLARTTDDVRAFLHDINAGVMGCTSNTPVRFHLTIGETGRITELTELPPDLPLDQGRCIRSLMGTVNLPGQADARGISATFAPVDVPSTGGAAPADCAIAVRAQIDRNAARVLACVADDAIAIAASWDEAGTVTLDVAHATDPTILECVRAGIGAVICPARAPAGHLLHPLAR